MWVKERNRILSTVRGLKMVSNKCVWKIFVNLIGLFVCGEAVFGDRGHMFLVCFQSVFEACE